MPRYASKLILEDGTHVPTARNEPTLKAAVRLANSEACRRRAPNARMLVYLDGRVVRDRAVKAPTDMRYHAYLVDSQDRLLTTTKHGCRTQESAIRIARRRVRHLVGLGMSFSAIHVCRGEQNPPYRVLPILSAPEPSQDEAWWQAKLRAGSVLPSLGWPDEVSCKALALDYSRCVEHADTPRGTATRLGRLLRRVCPEITKKQRSGGSRPYVYVLPDLETCLEASPPHEEH